MRASAGVRRAAETSGVDIPLVHDEAEAKALAASLDCFTEGEVRTLAGVTAQTIEAWRNRGKGPAYVLFGTRFLYPRVALAEHLKTLVRERKAPVKGQP